MDKSVIKESLARLLSANRITQSEYNTAIDKLDNPISVDEILTEIESEVRING